MMNQMDLGLAGMSVAGAAFPQACVSSDGGGTELSYGGVHMSAGFAGGGWEIRLKPFMALGPRLRVSRRNAYLDMGGGEEWKGRISRRREDVVVWRTRNADDGGFLRLIERLATTAYQFFEPSLVAAHIAETMAAVVPGGAWDIQGRTMRFADGRGGLLWLSWDGVENGEGLVDVHLEAHAALEGHLDPAYRPTDELLGRMVLLNGDDYVGCAWNQPPAPEDGRFTCCFDFAASREHLYAFTEGVARVAAAAPFPY